MNAVKVEIIKLLEKGTELSSSQIEDLLEKPVDSSRGDYSLVCFRLAKKWKKKPDQIAREFAGKLKPQGLISTIKSEGGYVNFFVEPIQLAEIVIKRILKEGDKYGTSAMGQGKTIVVDYSSPNIAKPFGIGHLRSTVIGQALYRIHQALGYRCVGINYLGDWGTQFGYVLSTWKGPARTELEPLGEWDVAKVAIKKVMEYYVLSSSSKDPLGLENARREFKSLENGNPQNIDLWKQFRKRSLEEFKRIYDLLGVKFDYYIGESAYNESIDRLLREIEQKGLSSMSEGALIMDLEPYGMPPVLLRKADESSLYATRDIAAAQDRYQKHKFHKLLYVVGSDQKLYFRQLFKALELIEYDWSKDCVHVEFGLIRFKGGKMSTREGSTILLEEVLQEAIDMSESIMEKRKPELRDKVDPARTRGVAQAVGIGAIIFNDLKNKRTRDIDFDWEQILSFDGETGPYLQYTHTRLASLIKKHEGDEGESQTINYKLLAIPEEMALVKLMNDFPEVIERAADEYEPSIISNYLLELASLFNRFYRYHRVISDDEALSRVRIILCSCLKCVFKQGLTLLGITPLEKM